MVFTLLSTRWILEALGTNDFGLYSLVAGLIAMLSFLNTAMAVGTQRNLSFDIGKNDADGLKSTFLCSIVIHIVLGIIIIFVLESIGVYYLTNFLNVPPERNEDAVTILHIMTLSMFLTIIGVPFLALLNSHEHLWVIAIVNIIESLWKFGIAFFLLSYAGDRLITYAFLILAMTLFSFFSMSVMCFIKYPETKCFHLKYCNWDKIKYLLTYSSWNIIGSIGLLLKGQGIAMIFNTFAGVAVNAAYGIASQINGQLSFFSNSIIRSFNPQIISSEGAGDHNRMVRLSFMSCKISTSLMLIIIVPLMFNLDIVLRLWLKNVPDYSVHFSFLILVHSIFYQMFHGMELAIHASGKIRNFSIFACFLNLLTLPVAYVLLKVGLVIETALIVSICATLFNMYNVAYNAERYCGVRASLFYKKVIFPLSGMLLISMLICFTISHCTSQVVSFFSSYIVNLITIVLLFLFMLLSSDERRTVFDCILKIRLNNWPNKKKRLSK